MKNMKLFGIIAGLILTGMTFIGCGKAESVNAATNQNVIIVAGNHAGNMKPTYSTCKEAVLSACKNEGALAVVVADGEPYLATGDYIDIPKQQSGLSSSKLKQIYTSQTEQIMGLLQSSMAETPEVDLLAALTLTSRELNSSVFRGGSTEVYVYDAGVSTKYLNMAITDLEYVDADSIVKVLQSKNMIPDLNGATIHWYGSGDTDYQISSAQADGIRKVWETVITAGGGNVIFYTDPATEKFNVELPEVTELPYTVELIEPGTSKPTKIDDIDTPIVFTEEEIGFEPGKASFIDTKLAAETLSTVTSYLKQHTDERILIAGTTADWGSKNYQSNLSTDRADVIKSFLINEGIDSSRLTTIGLASDSAFYHYDQNEDGTLNEEIADRNRSIVIMNIGSERAEQILSGSFKRGEMYE